METESKKVGHYEISGYEDLPVLGGYEYDRGQLIIRSGQSCSTDTFHRPFKCSLIINSGNRKEGSSQPDSLNIAGLVFDGEKYIFFSGLLGGFIFPRSPMEGLHFEFPPSGIEWNDPKHSDSSFAPGMMPERIAFLVEGLIEIPPTAFLIDQMKRHLILHYKDVLERGMESDQDFIKASFDKCLSDFPVICFNTISAIWLGELMFAIAWREARKDMDDEMRRNCDDRDFIKFQERFQLLLRYELDVLIQSERNIHEYYNRGEKCLCTQINVALLWSYVLSDQRFEGVYLHFNDFGYYSEREDKRALALNWRVVWEHRLRKQGFEGALSFIGIPAGGKSTLMMALSFLLREEDPEREVVGDITQPKSTAHHRAKGILSVSLGVTRPKDGDAFMDWRALSSMSSFGISSSLPENSLLAEIYEYLRYLGYTRIADLEVWQRLLQYGKFYEDLQEPYRYLLLQGAFEVPLIARVVVERTFEILSKLGSETVLMGDRRRVTERGSLPDELNYLEPYQNLPIVHDLVYSPKVQIPHGVRHLILGIIEPYRGELDELIIHNIAGVCLDVPPIIALERCRNGDRSIKRNNRIIWLRYSPMIRLLNLVLAKEFGWMIVPGSFQDNDGLKAHSPIKLAFEVRRRMLFSSMGYQAQSILARYYDRRKEEPVLSMGSHAIGVLMHALQQIQSRSDFPDCMKTENLEEVSGHIELGESFGEYRKVKMKMGDIV